MPIPWDKVILHGPQVLDLAKNLYGKWQARPKQSEAEPAPNDGLQTQLDKLFLRLKTLEEAAEKQAALAAELAEQNQALSIGLTTLKTSTENLQKEIEDAKAAQNALHSRVDELRAQLQQSASNVSAHKKKIMTAILISIGAFILSMISLMKPLIE